MSAKRSLSIVGIALAAALAAGCTGYGRTGEQASANTTNSPQAANSTTPGSSMDSTKSLGAAGGTAGSSAASGSSSGSGSGSGSPGK